MSTTDNVADADDEPTPLGASETEELTRSARKSQRASRRAAKQDRKTRMVEDDDEIVFVYEPYTRYVPPLRPYLRELWRRRAFAQEMARAKVRGKRSGSALGGVWSLLDPMFMVGIYYFLFTVIREGARPATFVPMLISGILHFQLTSSALNEGGSSVAGSTNLMLNSTFPRMLLPLSTIYAGIVGFLPSIVIIFGALVLLDVDLSVHLFWWFPIFALQMFISLGLALIISTAVVFFADIKNILTYITRIIFFTSPVIYPAEFLSTEIINAIRWSPFFGVFFNYQRIINATRPDWGMMTISIGWAIGSVLVGAWLFLRYEREFASHG
ncbi:MAG: transport permease protein [Acidimicrobiales bacterium]|nr:MAG: transport permease protein [Acidimicrobiales bacterium]